MTCPQCQKSELTERWEYHHYLESGLSNVTLRDIAVRRLRRQFRRDPAPGRTAPHHRPRPGTQSGAPDPAEIRFLRKHLGLSGADFARKFHCSPSQVSRWESETNPTPLSNAYELLLRTLVAQGEKIEDYQEHMEEIATIDEARPAVLALVHEESQWRMAA